MARKKSKSTQTKIAVRRLLEDEQVQKQLRNGAQSLREAYTRASRRPSRAAEDKKVYSKLQDAGMSFSTAARRLRRKPEPPKRTGRKLLAGGAVAGVGAFLFKKKQSAGSEPDPVAAYTPPAPVEPTPAPTPPPATEAPVTAA